MRMPRVSIMGMMVAATVIALDCAAIRSMTSRDEAFSGDHLMMFALGLPMAHVVAVAVAAIIRRRGRSNASHYSFVLGGVMGLIVVVGSMIFDLEWVGSYGRWCVHTMSWVIGRDLASAGEWVLLASVGPVFFALPQFLVALACGWAFGRLARSPRPAAGVRPIDPRARLAALATVLGLAAAPWAGLEAYYRWNVDPIVARFEVNSRAVFDLERGKVFGPAASPAFPAHWEGRPPSILADGAAVRVDGDGEPALIQAYSNGQAGQTEEVTCVDIRAVRVTVLDGPGAGQSTSVPRYFLRPIRR